MESLAQLFRKWFLNKKVLVDTGSHTVKGRLIHIEPSPRSGGFLGNVVLEKDSRRILVRGSQVQAIRRLSRD